MTYKTIFRTLLMTMAIAASSCTFEQEDFFDESASLRITHTNEKIQNRLVEQSADGKHGWVIQYFVAGTDEWNGPGFNLFGRFYDNGRVTLASNHQYLRNGNANKYTEATSTYEMLAEEGPVLSFNTWNDVLSVFEDPVDPTKAPGNLVNNGEGMYGDHNLVLKAFNDEDIIFRGERHSAEVRFVPCDRSWEEYIADTDKMKNKIATSTLNSYYVTNGVDTMYFSGLNRGTFLYCDRVDNPLVRKTIACTFTPDGFRTNRIDSLGTNTFQTFTIDTDSTCLLSEDQQVKVIACWDRYIADHTTIWKMDPAYFSAEQQNLYNQLAEQLLKANQYYVLESIGIGKTTSGNSVNGLVLTFYSNATKTRTNAAGLSMASSCPAFGQYQLISTPDDAYDNNMSSISRNAPEIITLARQFAATLNGVYDVTPDNYFLPTGGVFTATAGGTTFKLN